MSKEDFAQIYEIGCEHLSWVDDKLVDDLLSFLEDKVGEKAVITKNKKTILVGLSEKKDYNKRNVKTYLKKFLHKNDLKDKLRVISTNKNSYAINKLPGIEITRF
ncbi:MAG: 60S ribosomal protein L22 [Candidatus Helarchaeota archaeon]